MRVWTKFFNLSLFLKFNEFVTLLYSLHLNYPAFSSRLCTDVNSQLHQSKIYNSTTVICHFKTSIYNKRIWEQMVTQDGCTLFQLKLERHTHDFSGWILLLTAHTFFLLTAILLPRIPDEFPLLPDELYTYSSLSINQHILLENS